MSLLSLPSSLTILEDESEKNPTPNQSSQFSKFSQDFGKDFSFLIDIIRSLERTIEALNKRLETYENQNQIQNVFTGYQTSPL